MRGRWFRLLGSCASSLALFVGCSGDPADGGEAVEEEQGEGGEVVTACKDLCEVQAAGDGCPGEPREDCLGICDLFVDRTGECAARTTAAFECKQGMEWSCSPGSDQAFSTDGLCDAEQDAVSVACGH
jgi:hypothetical protein